MLQQTLPQWTNEFTDTFVPGEDQLGVEGAAQGYQQWLIPGIITTTDQARYYSFYAWVLHRFINASGSSRMVSSMDLFGIMGVIEQSELCLVVRDMRQLQDVCVLTAGQISHHATQIQVEKLVISPNGKRIAAILWVEG